MSTSRTAQRPSSVAYLPRSHRSPLSARTRAEAILPALALTLTYFKKLTLPPLSTTPLNRTPHARGKYSVETENTTHLIKPHTRMTTRRPAHASPEVHYFAVRAGAVAAARRPGAAGAAAALLLVMVGRPAAAARRALAVRCILKPNILGM